MNIFVLDNDITKCAQYHNDRHVVKMIVESVQILSTVCRLNGIDAGYKITHKHHPCVKWASKSLSNWKWLRELAYALQDEWKYRFNHPEHRTHKSIEILDTLPVPNIEDIGLTNFALAMPNECKSDSAINSYRKYYITNKNHLAKWSKRQTPEWFKYAPLV